MSALSEQLESVYREVEKLRDLGVAVVVDVKTRAPRHPARCVLEVRLPGPARELPADPKRGYGT